MNKYDLIYFLKYRIHFFSMYPNIHKIVEITDEGE